MRILVAGGTGFIGSTIVRELSSLPGYEVTVLSRNPIHSKFSDSIKWIQGDITRPETLKNLSGFQCVIQCVQFPNHPVQNPKKGYTYERYDAEGTENLIKALKGSGVKRIIYISGAGTRPHRSEPWFRAKIRAEEAIKDSGLDYVILRPSWVYGPGDKSMNRFVTFAQKLPFMPVIGKGNDRVSPLFVDDLARIVSRATESEFVKNRTIEVGGPQTLTMNEIQKTVMEVVGHEKILFHQPLWVMKFAGTVMSKVLSNPPLNAEAVDFVTMDIPVDSKPAEELFKMKFVDLKTALRSYINPDA